jgi:putative membrane protein
VDVSALPTVNAILNATSAILLVSGYYFIRRRKVAVHRACMLSAFGTSALFLVSYLVYHFQVGSVRFRGEGWIRSVYFGLLGSHTVLAVAVVPLVLVTLYRALRGRFGRHRAIARRTFPIWLYVSVTGVVVYVLLYHLYG